MTHGKGIGPLNDIKVLELGQLIAGPFCTRILGEFGAQVIKIESPSGGDPLRRWRKIYKEDSLWWLLQARNKQSITVNLKEEECQYENPKALAKRWLGIQSPEITFLDKYYELSDESLVEFPASRVLKKYKEVTGEKISLDTLISTMKNEGYSIKYGSNIISNISEKIVEEEPEETGRQTEL